MAESGGVIKEFLVALGFKADEAALKKFEGGIEKATKTVFGLAAAITATAVAVSAGVTKMSSSLEALYFASFKAGASATNLKAFDRAAQNLGTDAGEALESVQGLARFLRTNPGGEGLLASLGVKTRDANGRLRDTTELLLGLSRQFAQMPYFLANQYAGMFGISEDTLRAMRTGGFEQEFRRMQERMRNTGLNQAAKDARRFMVEVRDLVIVLEAFGVRVYDALVKRLGGGVGTLAAWIEKNGPMLAERTADAIMKLLDLLQRLMPAVIWLVNKFIELDKATDGWSTRILALIAVLKVFGGFAIIGGVMSLAGAFLKLAGGLTTAATAGSGLLGMLSRLGVVGATAAAAYAGGTAIQKALPNGVNDSIGRFIAQTLMLFRSRAAAEALALNDPVKYFEMRGWTKEQAAGIVANLQAESGMDPQAVGDDGQAVGIAQWRAPRQQGFIDRYGKPVEEGSLLEQLDYVNYELRFGAERIAGAMLKATKTAEQAAEAVARHYERPSQKIIEEQVAKRAQLAVQLSQDTKIINQGVTDPAETARRTRDEQERVNAQLVRNLQAALQ